MCERIATVSPVTSQYNRITTHSYIHRYRLIINNEARASPFRPFHCLSLFLAAFQLSLVRLSTFLCPQHVRTAVQNPNILQLHCNDLYRRSNPLIITRIRYRSQQPGRPHFVDAQIDRDQENAIRVRFSITTGVYLNFS